MRCLKCPWHLEVVGGIPWFFVDSRLKYDQWKVRIETRCETLGQEIECLEKNLKELSSSLLETKKVTEITLKRMSRQRDLKKFELTSLQHWAESLTWERSQPQQDHLPPLAKKAFFDPMSYQQTLESYRTHALRDWSWQSEENAIFYDLVRPTAIPKSEDNPGPPGVCLVAGCGSGRLLWDLATDPEVPWSALVGFDINPYLLHIGATVIAGDSLDLIEWPVAPRLGYETGSRHTLRLPQTKPLKIPLHLWAGDWLNPPFSPGSLAAIITPWIIDILPEIPQHSIVRIFDLLEPGGLWTFAGSTAFQKGAPQDRWSRGEFLAAVQDAGFEVQVSQEKDIPYLHSPCEAQKRWENILVFRARKPLVGNPARGTQSSSLGKWPPWLIDHQISIPRNTLFKNQAHHHKILSLTLDLIDGKRSVADMAAVIAPPVGVSPEAACRSVAAFLQALWEQQDGLQQSP